MHYTAIYGTNWTERDKTASTTLIFTWIHNRSGFARPKPPHCAPMSAGNDFVRLRSLEVEGDSVHTVPG